MLKIEVLMTFVRISDGRCDWLLSRLAQSGASSRTSTNWLDQVPTSASSQALMDYAHRSQSSGFWLIREPELRRATKLNSTSTACASAMIAERRSAVCR
eukprot:4487271-Pleurochrysis_carterae.AAC.3